ncbi:MAG: hypothetical protein VB876_04760 [Pirellulales bacterium]
MKLRRRLGDSGGGESVHFNHPAFRKSNRIEDFNAVIERGRENSSFHPIHALIKCAGF